MDFLSNVSILCLPSASSSLCAGSDPQAGIPGLLCSGEWLLRPFHPVMTGKRANSGEEPVLQGRRWWGHREPLRTRRNLQNSPHLRPHLAAWTEDWKRYLLGPQGH